LRGIERKGVRDRVRIIACVSVAGRDSIGEITRVVVYVRVDVRVGGFPSVGAGIAPTSIHRLWKLTLEDGQVAAFDA
jgi:hypothetical protein